MSKRTPSLTSEQYARVRQELMNLATRAAEVGNVIGPAFGAKWCDKALKLHNHLMRLLLQVEDEYDRRQ